MLFFALRSLAAGLSLAGSVHSAPTVLDRAMMNMLAERAIQSPINGLPGCDNEKLDPTWAQGKSNFTDGEGKRIGDDCDNNAWTNDNCLTEYFVVGTTQKYGAWKEPMGPENCGNGTGLAGSVATCSQSLATMKQQCTSFEVSCSESIKADFGGILGDIGISFTSTQTWGSSTCNANTSTSMCTWSNEPGCHAAHIAPLIYTVHGYKRRSCASPTSDPKANMPNTQQRPDGLFTRGMQDFAVPLIQTNYVDCNATCGVFASTLPAPHGGQMIPWPKDDDQP